MHKRGARQRGKGKNKLMKIKKKMSSVREEGIIILYSGALLLAYKETQNINSFYMNLYFDI